MRPLAIEDLKENDRVEGLYKGFLVRGKVKRCFGSVYLEVKARPAGRARIPLSQIEIPRKLTK